MTQSHLNIYEAGRQDVSKGKTKSTKKTSRDLDVQQEADGVLNDLLELDEEGGGLTSVNDTVVVGKGNVHHRADLNLAVNSNGSLLNGVHAQNGALGHVDNGSTHHRAKDTTVRDGEGTAGQVLNGNLAITGLGSVLGNALLNLDKRQRLSVADDGGDETLGGGNGNRDIDIVVVDDRVTLDSGVDSGQLLKSVARSLDEGRHESKLDVVLLQDGILVVRAELHEVGHVDLVEGGERGSVLLRLLQALGDGLTHAVHLDAALLTAEGNGGGGGLGRSSGGLGGSRLRGFLLGFLLLGLLLLGLLLLGGGSSGLLDLLLLGLLLRGSAYSFIHIGGQREIVCVR